MNYLQIHDSRPFTEDENKCIARLKEIMKPEDTYEMIELPFCEDLHETVDLSDSARFKWLSEHPKGAYVDTDCYIVEPFIPKTPGKCCFPVARSRDRIDIFYIIVNGNPEYIKTNFSNRPHEERPYYGWPKEPLERIYKSSSWIKIPEINYNHIGQTAGKVMKARDKYRVEMAGKKQKSQLSPEQGYALAEDNIVRAVQELSKVSTTLKAFRKALDETSEENDRLTFENNMLKRELERLTGAQNG